MIRFDYYTAWVVFLASALCQFSWSADTVDFNRDVRPLFNQHCVACHGGVKQASDLSFVYEDQAMLVVEPGDAADSEMILRVTAEDGDEALMPPAEHGRRLTAREVAILREWINEGAKWGKHWAYDPPKQTSPPKPLDDASDRGSWGRNKIDRFVLPVMRANDLSPSEDAAPDRWLRRVSLDLIGLPPTPQQRAQFLDEVNSDGEAAYEAAVERLLQSPSFGERWASVWLDVIRYADSRGMGADGRRTIWKYRDWVIRAFNDDMPYDQFTVRQLAGDLLPDATIDDLVATASQRVTQTNEEGGTDDETFRTEAVIDRVNTTWQAWQGLSFGCVQCHSHPYDPIRHEEYYRFLAYFNNTRDCDLNNDAPTIAVPLDAAEATKARELDRQIEQLWNTQWSDADEMLSTEDNWQSLKTLTAKTNNATKVQVSNVDGADQYETQGTVSRNTTVTVEGELPSSEAPLTAIRFTGLPEDIDKAKKDSEWGFLISHFKASIVPAEGEATALKIAFVVADEPDPLVDPQESLNEKSSQGFGAYSRINYPRSGAFILESPVTIQPGDRLRVSLSQKTVELGAFPLVARRGRISISSQAGVSNWWSDESRVTAREQLAELRKQRKKIPSVSTPVLQERRDVFTRGSYVFDRGNQFTKADRVQPSTPSFLPSMDNHGSSRLEMARWIASPKNPLTARVAVNRAWAQLFGTGLVETQEDFGTSGSPPSHPLLLDDLADRFQTEMQWSTKSLLKEMVLSSTYRQTSRAAAEKHIADPANRFLSRGPRGRLPAESIRDQALAVSGLLSDKMFGAPVHPPIPAGIWKPFQGGDKWKTPDKGDPDRYRRTIYTYTKRSIQFPMMASFDAPTREFCSVRRLPSNTPLQALMTLNDAAFVEAGEALAVRMREAGDELGQQIQFGFLLTTCREPREVELEALVSLVKETKSDVRGVTESEAAPYDPLQAVAAVLLNLDEVLTK